MNTSDNDLENPTAPPELSTQTSVRSGGNRPSIGMRYGDMRSQL